MKKDDEQLPPEVVRSLTLLTPTQVCELLHVTRDWLYDEVAKGEIPVVRLGRQLRFRPADLENWLSR